MYENWISPSESNDWRRARGWGFFPHRGFLDHLKHNYEPFTRWLLQESFRRGMTVIDGGAHIGLYLLNLRHNGCGNVIASSKALSASMGKTYFYQSTGPISSSLFRRHEFNSGAFNVIEAETTTLDNELAGMNLNDVLIKLDLEGAEPMVFHGMEELLAAADKLNIIFEFHPKLWAASGNDLGEVLHFLWQRGFYVYEISQNGELRLLGDVANYVCSLKSHVNLLARKMREEGN